MNYSNRRREWKRKFRDLHTLSRFAFFPKLLHKKFLIIGFNPEKNSYDTVSNNLKAFQQINTLPTLLLSRCEKYESFEKLCAIFLEKKAVFHKSCISAYNKQKHERKRKLPQVKSLDPAFHNGENNESEVFDSEAKQRSTRRSEKNPTHSEKCFFCGEFSKDMHRCQTLELNQKVRDIEIEMGDNQMLAKLRQGDMVAVDAKYHLRCLVDYKNKYRSSKSSGKVLKESSLIERIFFKSKSFPRLMCFTEQAKQF